MGKFTHVDDKGHPGMVDVSNKIVTSRKARASGELHIGRETMAILKQSQFSTTKGSIIQTAVIAGTMATKKTSEVIPFCHQIPLSGCRIEITPTEEAFKIICEVKTEAQTGVEMEAIHGVTSTALALYDMCKSVSQKMIIQKVRLEEKTGGKSDYYV